MKLDPEAGLARRRTQAKHGSQPQALRLGTYSIHVGLYSSCQPNAKHYTDTTFAPFCRSAGAVHISVSFMLGGIYEEARARRLAPAEPFCRFRYAADPSSSDTHRTVHCRPGASVTLSQACNIPTFTSVGHSAHTLANRAAGGPTPSFSQFYRKRMLGYCLLRNYLRSPRECPIKDCFFALPFRFCFRLCISATPFSTFPLSPTKKLFVGESCTLYNLRVRTPSYGPPSDCMITAGAGWPPYLTMHFPSFVSAFSAAAAALLFVTSTCGASPVAPEPASLDGWVDLFPRRPQIDVSDLAESRVRTLWRSWDRAYEAEVGFFCYYRKSPRNRGRENCRQKGGGGRGQGEVA